jgi:hypothetical protein
MLLAPVFKPRRAVPAPQVASGTFAGLVLGASVVAAVIGAAEFTRRNAPCIDSGQQWAPDRAAANFIGRSGLKGRLLVWFDWGEYAIWHFAPGLKVSMDGRRETVYSLTTLRRLYDLFDTRAEWRSDLATLDPTVAWLRPELPLTVELERQGWHRAFASSNSVVLTRHPAPPPSELALSGPRCFPD